MEYVNQKEIDELKSEYFKLNSKREKLIKNNSTETKNGSIIFTFDEATFFEIEKIKSKIDILYYKIMELRKDVEYSEEEKENMKHMSDSIKEYEKKLNEK